MKTSMGLTAVAVAVIAVFSACSRHGGASRGDAASAPAVAAMPDAGHVAARKVSTEGSGPSEEQALLEALKTAVMEVNGTTISVADLSVQGDAQEHLRAQDSDGDSARFDAYLHSEDFVHAVAQQSGGVIDHFAITKVDKPGLLSKQYTLYVDSYINEFHAAKASAKKLKIVVAPVRTQQATYDLGGVQIAASALSSDLTQRITQALVQSGRFDVLDRASDPSVAKELDLISSGGTDRINLARLNQTIPADVVLASSVDALAYDRHSQALAISDHPLVSYDGHWAFSDKIINVTTRELMSSGQYDGAFPAVAPTTMPVTVDGAQLLADAEAKIAHDAAAQVIRELYPITVVAVQGATLVFSQGGASVQAGASYRLMRAGQLIKDPQTGETIGHVKTPVGVVLIDRVDDKLSYGHLTSGSLGSIASDGSVRLGEQLAQTAAATVAAASAPPAAPPATAPSSASPSGQVRSAPASHAARPIDTRAAHHSAPRTRSHSVPNAAPRVDNPAPAAQPSGSDPNW